MTGFPAAARSAAYWRARADEHRDYLQFRLHPETEEYHRQEALFCDGCAGAAERREGKSAQGRQEKTKNPVRFRGEVLAVARDATR